MNKTIGLFLSDTHFPDNINLKPVLNYAMDLRQQAKENKDNFTLILGGDIIDAKGMHGVDSLQASQIKLEWYERDKTYLKKFLLELKEYLGTQISVVYLEGNHEERYKRIMNRYPDAFGERFNFNRDVLQKVFPGAKWIPYATYESYYKLGDCVFKHGTLYPQNHARQYAMVGLPNKTIYGHLHHFQAFTYHSDMPTMPPRYAVTSGCLCHLSPEWKKGAPHMWLNGFISFMTVNGVTTPSVHIIEKGKFQVGGKVYE